MKAKAKRKKPALKKRTAKKTPVSLKRLTQYFSNDMISQVVHFLEDKPFEILGPHVFKGSKKVVVNAFLPRASKVWISNGASIKKPLKKIHPKGFYQGILSSEEIGNYRIGFCDESGYCVETKDPYAFPTLITDYDLYLLSEGNHFKSYEKLGAQLTSINGVSGVHFAVWAPNAKSISIVGNFNHWHVGEHPMTRVGASGIWALFIPELKEGEVYKYAIRSWVDNDVRIKADPYAFKGELRPHSASVVANLNHYQWHDHEWVDKRMLSDHLEDAISIYEVHLGSWKRKGPDGTLFSNYKDLAHELVNYVKEMGYTHIELLPIMEHPYDQSWGYQTLSYFAPTSRFGNPDDFMYFVDHCHQNGIGVILDWVPSHFPKDGHGLAYFDGKQIYAYEHWKRGEHKDWGTFIFDYGKNEVRNFLISSALFWLDKYHIDGIRVDAVASMLYLDYSKQEGEWEANQYGGRENLEAISFLKKFNEVVHANYPGVLTTAEESTAWTGVSRPTYLGGLGFSMKWNMGWMHDTLEYFAKEAVHRKFHQDTLTFSMIYAFTENFILPLSHDEVVHGKRSLIYKMPGDDWQRFANLRLLFGLMFAHPGKKLLFMGDDFAQTKEWDATVSLDWHLLGYAPHQEIHKFARDLNDTYKKNKALYEVDFGHHGFEWIDFSDAAASLLSFIRWSKDFNELVLFTCNMTPVPRMSYRVGVPKAGFYEEILNSDAKEYGGSGVGNLGGVYSEPTPWHGRPHSIVVHFPPLAANLYRFRENK